MGVYNDYITEITGEFTGDVEVFEKISNRLRSLGYTVSNGVHIGGNRYEFEEDDSFRFGCRNLHKILAWEEDGVVKYQTEVIGFFLRRLI